MSQGIYAALSHLETQIMSITPKTDIHHGFVCYDRANGHVTPQAQRFNNNRTFELVLTTFPEDDGAAGLSGRRRVEVACEVRYDISAADVLYLQRLAAEDGERIPLNGGDVCGVHDEGCIRKPARPNVERATA